MQVNLITTDDLHRLRVEIIQDLKALLIKAPPKPKQLLKSREVRAMLKVSNNTLLNYRKSGKLKCSKVGGTFYYRYDDIMKLMEEEQVDVSHNENSFIRIK